MSVEKALQNRSNNQCELCKATNSLKMYDVPPNDFTDRKEEKTLLLCEKCTAQLEKREALDNAHWACLNDSMWSETPAVQVVSWRMLNRLRHESWAVDALEMMYLDDTNLAWAKQTGDHELSSEVILHKDCNGVVLQAGDSVVLIKSLEIRGSAHDAKMGTVVRNIKLVADNVEQIEGKIEGQTIVILTKYVRKS